MARYTWILFILLVAGNLTIAQNEYRPPGIHKLPSIVNTPLSDEIAPIWTWDGSTMYFTRIKDPKFNKTLIYKEDDLYKTLPYGEYVTFLKSLYRELGDQEPRTEIYQSPYNQDVFLIEMKDGAYHRSMHPPHPLNNALPNSVCAIMPDQKTLVLMNQFYQNGSMYKGFSTTRRVNDFEFSWPEPLFIYDFKELSGTDANLTLSRNGEVMILAFDRNKGTGTDLHVCFRVNTNTYSEPIPLKNLNSPLREFSPSLSQDGKFLFFSSTRGQFPYRSNLYVSQRLDDTYTRWSEPQKLIPPINSEHNDGHPFLLGKKLYFSSDRDGSWDIFYFDFDEFAQARIESDNVVAVDDLPRDEIPAPPPPVVEEIKKQLVKTARIRVVDSQTKEPVNAMVLDVGSDGKTRVRFEVDKNGFLMEFKNPEVVTYYPQVQGHITKPYSYDIAALLQDAREIPTIDIPVDAIRVNNSIKIDPIYFKKGTDRILSISYGEIRRLAAILKNHANIHILIKGHSDNFGDMQALIDLSEKRAFAVKSFLQAQNIDPDRIEIKGMGPREPITDNSTEELKAQNRRVEIIISKINEP